MAAEQKSTIIRNENGEAARISRLAVMEKVAGNLGFVDRKQAPESAVAFHNKIRRTLNDLHALTSVANDVELKGQAASEISGFAKEGLSMIPVVGGFLGQAADRITRAIERKLVIDDLDGVSKLSPAHDQNEWCNFTKKLSNELVERRASELASCDSKQAEKLAKRDCKLLVERISKGNLPFTIDDSDAAEKLADMVVKKQRPSTTPQPQGANLPHSREAGAAAR